VAVMDVALTTLTPVAAVPPNVTVAPLTNALPLIVTDVPPAVGPELGETALTVGAFAGATYVNPLVSVPLCASGLTTVTFAAPAAWAGVVAVIDVVLTTLTAVAAAPPMLTVAPLTNPLPLIVIEVPPAVGPEVGEIALTVGAGATYVNPLVRVPV